MLNPHPFYRWETGWNTGFYPDNQIASDLLNEIYLAVTAALPTWVTVGVTTLPQLKLSLRTFIDQYNAYPYYGNYTIVSNIVISGTDYIYNFYIRDLNLYKVDPSQEVWIFGLANVSNKVITASGIYAGFTPGAYTGTFDAPLIPEETKVKEALEVINLNGSAFFPITYSFDPLSLVASSGLARGKDWRLDGNEIERFPAPANPYENQRKFQLPQLNADDAYVISIMERIIQASLQDNDYTNSVLATYNSFTLPDGWTSAVSNPGFTTYNRVQFDFIDSTRRKFILVGRLDEEWLWQRFVSDEYGNAPFDFLTAYTESTALPYDPNQAGRWIYNSDTFDFEFVEFTSGCYVSPEFYPMPAKPGDQWQFNVVDGNLEGIDQVDVGLFTEDGLFVQKIGEAVIDSVTLQFSGFWWQPSESNIGYSQWYNDVYTEWGSPAISFKLSDCNGNPIGGTLGTIPAAALINSSFALFKTEFESIEFPSVITSAEVNQVGGQITFTLAMRPSQACFCGIQMVMMDDEDVEHYFIDPADLSQNYPQQTQHQASVTIPSKNGCFRMGLYRLPEGNPSENTNCTVTFEKEFNQGEFSNTEEFMIAVNALFGSENPYLAFKLSNGISYVYTVISNTTTPQQIADWANTIPGMVATWIEDTFILNFAWTREVECGSEVVFSGCASNESGECIDTEYPWFSTQSACCPCEPKCELSFNLDLTIGGGGCPDFTPAGQEENQFAIFLTPDNDLPYDNKYCLKTIPVSEIPSDETQQDFMANWFLSIPGVSVTYDPLAEPCVFVVNWTIDLPCDTPYKLVTTYVDESNELTSGVTSTEQQSCPCPPAPEPDTFYGLYSLSNIIKIDASDCFSTILEYWADSNQIAQSFEYFNDWKQRVRIGLNGGGEKPVLEESLYRQSNGVHRRPQNKQDLSVDLHTDFFDLDTQLAMTDATRHPYLIWEGKSIFVKGDIEVATTQDFTTQSSFETLSQMKFQALIQGFQPRNSSCLTC